MRDFFVVVHSAFDDAAMRTVLSITYDVFYSEPDTKLYMSPPQGTV